MKQTYEDGAIYATQQLIKKELFRGQVYLTGNTERAMGSVLHGQNRNALFFTSADFMTYECRYPHVIAEPDQKKISEVARRALQVVFYKVALLVPVKFLPSAKCASLIADTPLVRVYMLPKKLPHRWSRMAWMVWEKGNYDPPTIRWTE